MHSAHDDITKSLNCAALKIRRCFVNGINITSHPAPLIASSGWYDYLAFRLQLFQRVVWIEKSSFV